MLDAAKIRTTKTVLRHVGLPAAALGLSILLGAGINQLVRPALGQWSKQALGQRSANGAGSQANSDLTGRLMAAELMAVEPVAQSSQANTVRRTIVKTDVPDNQPVQSAAFDASDAPAIKSTAVSTPTVTTSLEPSVTQAAMSNVDRATPAPTTDVPTPVVSAHGPIPAGHRVFNGRLIRPARTITMVTTAYSPDERSCGPNADGTTASGKSVWTNGMKMVAADTRLLPFGTLVSVPGYYGGQPVPVLDRGGAIKGNRLDMLYPTHEIAVTWGRKTQKVTIWEYVD